MAYYGKGSSGQILTDLSAPDMSTFQAAASQFTPNSIVNISTDFLDNSSSGSSTFAASNWAARTARDLLHPGTTANSSLTSGVAYLRMGTGGNPMYLGGGQITLNWVFLINTASNGTNRYTLNVGIGDQNQPYQNGVYFTYSDNINSGNWQFTTISATTATTSNSSTAASTGFHNAQLVINAAGTSVSFLMDGVLLGTSTTNIPGASISPGMLMTWIAGTVASSSIETDLFYMTQILSSSR